MEQLVADWNRICGQQQFRTLRASHDAAIYYCRAKEFEKAEAHMRVASDGFRRLYGGNNYFTLLCTSKLGRIMFYALRYDECEKIYRKVHATVVAKCGASSEDAYRAQNNIALACFRRHNITESLQCARDASTGWLRVVADNEERTVEALISLVNLGHILQSQYKHAEVEKIFRRVHKSWNTSLGDEHPNTLLALSCVGVSLRSSRRLLDAEPILKNVLDLREKVLGPLDPDTLESYHDMAVFCKISRRTDEAYTYHQHALDKRIELLGGMHMDSLTSDYHLALLYVAYEMYDTAIKMLKECLQDTEDLLGIHHPLLMNVGNALANAYSEIGDEEKADQYYRKALAGLEKVFGNAHPDTLRLVRNMASNYHYLKQFDVSEGYWRRALDGMIAYYGPNHPETLWVAVQLALVLEIQFKDDEAERFYKWVLEGRKKLAQQDMTTLDPQSFNILRDIERLTRDRKITDPLITNTILLAITKWVADNIAIKLLRGFEHTKKMWKQKRIFCPRRKLKPRNEKDVVGIAALLSDEEESDEEEEEGNLEGGDSFVSEKA